MNKAMMLSVFSSSNNAPFLSDAFEVWDYRETEIITVGENKYFAGKNGHNLLITGYDFDAGFSKGFLYKTAATVSAPAADTAFIAADVNNFFYASNGTPNQIPVVSLFENVDYAGKLFNRHYTQTVNELGFETYEPRVWQTVLYNTQKTGTDLERCNSYFKVPEKNAAAKYIPTDYLTNTAAITALGTGSIIYDKNGTYTEVSSSNNLRLDKQNKVKSLGLVVLKRNTGANYTSTHSGNSSCENFIFDAEAAANGPSLSGSNNIYRKNYIKNLVAAGYLITNLDLTSEVKYNIWKQANCITLTNSPVITIDSCLLNTIFNFGMLGYSIASGGKHTIKNCKIITSKNTNGVPIFGGYNTVTGQGIKDVDFINNNVTINLLSSLFAIGNSSEQGTVNIKNNNFKVITGESGSSLVNIAAASNKAGVFYNIENNQFIINDKVARFFQIDGIRGVNCINNRSEINRCIASISNATESVTYKNNVFWSLSPVAQNNDNYSGIVVNRTTNTGVYIPIAIEGNNVKNARAYGQTYGDHGCVMVNNYNDYVIRYNRLEGAGIANVIMRNDTVASSANGVCSYNVSVKSGLLSKGVSDLKIYNNSIFEPDGSGIRLMLTQIGSPSRSNIVKNNIVIDRNIGSSAYLVQINDEDASYKHTIDYNVYYSTKEKPFIKDTTEYTFSEWQALGYDTHSVMLTTEQVDSLFPTGQLYSSTPQVIGENLGESNEDGLDISTNWGSQTTIPSIVTKKQLTVGAWQVGAYIQ